LWTTTSANAYPSRRGRQPSRDRIRLRQSPGVGALLGGGSRRLSRETVRRRGDRPARRPWLDPRDGPHGPRRRTRAFAVFSGRSSGQRGQEQAPSRHHRRGSANGDRATNGAGCVGAPGDRSVHRHAGSRGKRVLHRRSKHGCPVDVESELTGGCFCGAVRYGATRPPEAVATCYCADCTRAVGSVVTVWARFASSHFRFTAGEPVRFESSPGITRTFCGRCGTSLSYHYRDGGRVDVATATLDDPASFPPTQDGPDAPRWMK
jgi:hypothetical protein